MSDRWPLSAFGDEIAPDLEEQVEALRALDVGSVELRAAWGVNVVDLDPEQLARAARVLREGGIGVSAVGAPVGKSPIDGDFEDELGRLRAAFRAADTLGTGLVRVFSFYVDGECERHRDEVLRRMAAMAAEAQGAGVVLAHENESLIYGDAPERCADLLRSVGSPALRAVFDPANFVQVGVARPFDAGWPLLREYVTHVHVKDAVPAARDGGTGVPAPPSVRSLGESVRPAGQGAGQVPELLRALAAEGYQGYLTLEPHLTGTHPDLTGRARMEIAVTALRSLLAELAPA
jgi:sugar phosphate isomerase/epimerase